MEKARITMIVEQKPGGAEVESDFTNYNVSDLLACHGALVVEICSVLEGDFILESAAMREMLNHLANTFAEGKGEQHGN